MTYNHVIMTSLLEIAGLNEAVGMLRASNRRSASKVVIVIATGVVADEQSITVLQERSNLEV